MSDLENHLEQRYSEFRALGHGHAEAVKKAAHKVHDDIWHTLPPEHEDPEPTQNLLDGVDSWVDNKLKQVSEDAPTMSMAGGGIATRPMGLGTARSFKGHLMRQALGRLMAAKRMRRSR